MAIGSAVEECKVASEILSKLGIRSGVVNARFVKPLDEECIRRVAREAGLIITVEDGCLIGGFGSAVAEFLSDRQMKWVKLLRLGFPDEFVEHGTRAQLLEQYGLSATAIAAKAAAFFREYGAK